MKHDDEDESITERLKDLGWTVFILIAGAVFYVAFAYGVYFLWSAVTTAIRPSP